jgi:hypothetical protein
VTSDCGAVQDIYQYHNYTANYTQAAADALNAGLDTECTWGGNIIKQNLPTAIQNGSVTKATARRALGRLFRVRMRLGEFDSANEQPYMKYGTDRIDTPAHRQLALDAARQGIVLLKNDGGVLPLKANDSSIKLVASMGPTAGSMSGDYSGAAPFIIGPAAALQSFLPKPAALQQISGCSVDGNDTSGIAKAAALAGEANVTLLFVGNTHEGETVDRPFIKLPDVQEELMDAVAAAVEKNKTANNNTLILVVIGGGAVDLTKAKADPRVSAILWAGYPGQSGGQAIAEVVFGATVPSGRLTQTFYDQAWADSCSMYEMSMRPTKDCPEGRSHRFYTGTPVYKFGDGKSYTTFEHGLSLSLLDPSSASSSTGTASTGDSASTGTRGRLSLPQRTLLAQATATRDSPHTAPAVVRATVTARNTGALAAAHVLLLFASPPPPQQQSQRPQQRVTGAPLRNLVAFERVWLEPGESKSVGFDLTAHHLSYADQNGDPWVAPGAWQLFVDNEPTAAAAAAVAVA